MPAQPLLERLDKVRGNGPSWIARCPAHKDRGPSLSIHEEPDGRVLIHCFAGCEPADIIAAVGLDWQSLMPPKRASDDRAPSVHGPSWSRETVRLMRHELTLAVIVLGNVQHARRVTDSDRQRAGKAADTLSMWLKALDLCAPQRKSNIRRS